MPRTNEEMRWEILGKSNLKEPDIVKVLLKNRGIKSPRAREEFFNPTHPNDLALESFGINLSEIKRGIARIKSAIKKEEMIVIYGDYDVDGICGTGILFETLYAIYKNVHPHLPDRFSEGYGLNPESVTKLKENHPNLGVIITVDNGISAAAGVEKARELGIDVIVLDHHHKKGKTPRAYATVYTKKIGGAEIAWIFSREMRRKLKIGNSSLTKGDGLELAALGTIADMLPLVGVNRSFAWHGIKALRGSTRPGLLALFKEAGIDKEKIGSYEINYVISPRLNAAGRLEQAIDSLRLVCTGSSKRAGELAKHLGAVNLRRQKVQEEILLHARSLAGKSSGKKVLILAHESYHEGVVGLAAARLVEEFGLPAIVFSKGKEISKGSGRSVYGFDLVEALSKVESHLISWGGHKAAAGLTLPTKNLKAFTKEFAKIASPLLTEKILERKLKIDLEVNFESLGYDLLGSTKLFEPTGMGNPTPDFATFGVNVLAVRAVGVNGKHLKLKLEQGGFQYDAIAFSRGELYSFLSPGKKIDISYSLTENTWNGRSQVELKIKDIKLEK